MFNPTYFPRQRWAYPKEHERNFVASFFHAISITLLSTSLVHMVWFRIYGVSECEPYVPLNQFFSFGYFETRSVKMTPTARYFDGIKSSQIINLYHPTRGVISCVTPQAVFLIRIVILLCLAAIGSSIIGFCLDVIGPKKKLLRIIRQNGLPSIITVLLIVSAIGLCYLVATSLQSAAMKIHPNDVGAIQVAYKFGYYTITIAGAVSILATACNLLQSSTPPEEIQRHRLIEDLDGLETFSVGMRNMPEPPPPYTP